MQTLLYSIVTQLYSKCTNFVRLILRQFLMATARDQLFALLKPKWNWAKVNSELITKSQGKTIGVSLNPTITFENLQKQGVKLKLEITLSIDIQKSLQFDSSIGWNWHKSSNLPVISLKAECQDLHDSEHKYLLPESLEARIFAVKVVVNPLERQKISHLEDVGLRGMDRVEIKDGIGIFNGIRFKTTSYINEGVKFHLLVVLYFKDQNESPEFRNIVSSVISPAIFVDSRKSARDHFEKRFISFAHVFHPDLLQREFLKKSVKDKANQCEVRVQNSMDGLYNYLTAPNIRHKVKHPLFLCVKFSNVFQILFNSKQVEFQNSCHSKMKNIIFRLQKILLSQIGRKRKNDRNGFQMEKPFLMGIMGQCSSSKKSKIYECLQFLNCNSIELVKYNYQVGPHFQNIFDSGDMVEVYRNAYEELKEASSRDQEPKDEEDDDNQDENEGQEKKIKGEELESQEREWKQTRRIVSLSQNREENLENLNKMEQAVYGQSLPENLPMQIFVPGMEVGLLSHYSSIIQQIELQNQLLGNIIRENTTIKQKMMAYCKGMNANVGVGYDSNAEANYNQLRYFGNVGLMHIPQNQGNKNANPGVKREE